MIRFITKILLSSAMLLPLEACAKDRGETGQSRVEPASPAQANLHRPLDIPLLLSGNFGEIRSNHFHSGLDFKTQGRTGLKIYCAADGYVSRILVSPWGFGRAVYVTHPELGLTTVYGHLESFSPAIEKVAHERQMADESFRIDINLEPGQIPVKRGEVIARSGNAGSSGGPHLHMDVRDAITEEALDPMPYFASLITDKRAPRIASIALIPVEGVVDGSNSTMATRADAALSKPFTAWGRVAPGIRAVDVMDGTTNTYGIKKVTLMVDGEQVFQRYLDHFSFDDSRAVNTIIHYPSLAIQGTRVMTSQVAESNPLGYITTATDQGVITIHEGRDYKCQWILEDSHGNVSKQAFTIHGQRQSIPSVTPKGTLIPWAKGGKIEKDGVKVTIPEKALYNDTYIDVTTSASDKYLSPIVAIGSKTVPLARTIDIEIPVNTENCKLKTENYCLVYLGGKTPSAVATTYRDGKACASVNRLGRYAVTTDTTAPTITPLNQQKWRARGRISFKIADTLSGIDTYRGEVDGKWILMELDGKTGTLSAPYPTSGKTLTLTVTDACGNSTTRTYPL